ncbi:MAG TPA: FAD-dependent monooxygenase [Alphaproteobacteria bacterium]|nr:FAD-dependent monooxygenase [Alphaproteobacteria bacterium]
MKTEVLIIGGGIAGLSLATLLGKAGLSAIVVEQRNFPIPNKIELYGRTAALMGGSINILKALGVWDDIKSRTAPLKTMRIIDDSNPNIDPVQIDFPATEIGKDSYGQNIPNNMLHQILAETVEKLPTVTLLQLKTLEKFTHDTHGVTALLDDGMEITANLIVGADGRNSKVREQAGIGAKEKIYDQKAITVVVEHSKSHNFISTEHHRPGGPFTTVPMPDQDGKHHSAIVWVEKADDADEYIKMDKSSMENAIKIRSRGALGNIKLIGSPQCWPLKGIIADKITAARLALIAEAAHVMSPIGAQGLNLSLRDVASLAEVLIDAARLGEDIGGEMVTARYAKRHHIDMTSRFLGVDSYNRIVSNNIGFLRGIRRAGLKTLQTIPAFKHFAMHQGLSPAMDEGRLMRGEKL